jgi:hypothetical protein
MAVIQISKIQLRRGREQEEGIPQLASGELAWAVDTQKLFIGNGAVSEGSPQVGNTRLLTEKDNIFELAQDYQYRENDTSIQTGLTTNYPVLRTLQQRLDEKVTNEEYGIYPNGLDQAATIQNAIDNLFLNPAYITRNNLRVTLEFLPGTYLISTTIFLPSNVTIVGAGIDKTVFQFTGLSQPVFRFVNDSSTKTVRSTIASTTYINQPKNILLKGFTVTTGDPSVNGFKIDAVRDSIFEDIRIDGSYGDSGSNQSRGLDISALSSVVTTQRNQFVRMKFDGMKFSVHSKYDIRDNVFSNCEFINGFIGVLFGLDANLSSDGEEYGPRNNIIAGCMFTNIDRQGIFVVNGYGNRSVTNNFINVGNDGGGNQNNETAIIRFDTNGNSSSDDIFDRRIMPYDTLNDLSSNNFNRDYVAEVQGKVHQEINSTNRVDLISSNIPIQFMRFPVDTDASIEISYLMKSTKTTAPQYNQVRKGKIHLVVDYLNIDLVQQHVRLVDEYEFVGEEFDDDNIIFTASINGGDVFVSYVNYNGSDTSMFEYSYRYLN